MHHSSRTKTDICQFFVGLAGVKTDFDCFGFIAPTGPHQIETVSVTMRDESRIDTYSSSGENRSLEVKFWYPKDAQNFKYLNKNDPKYQSVHLSGIGHMHLCDFQLVSPFLSWILSGRDSSNSAKKNLEMVNQTILDYFGSVGF